MWHAWNAAQDFDVEASVDEFEEAVPDLPLSTRAMRRRPAFE